MDIHKKRAQEFKAMKAEVKKLSQRCRDMDRAILDREALIDQLSQQSRALAEQVQKLEASYQKLKEAKDEDLW